MSSKAGAAVVLKEGATMRLLIGILVAMAVGIWALGAFFDALQESVHTGRNWPVTRSTQ